MKQATIDALRHFCKRLQKGGEDMILPGLFENLEKELAKESLLEIRVQSSIGPQGQIYCLPEDRTEFELHAMMHISGGCIGISATLLKPMERIANAHGWTFLVV